jgi:PhnB protein
MMEFAPYIFFYGRCEEALAFYATALGGSSEITRVGDTPMKDSAPPETHKNVMHASFTAPGITFMASDGQSAKPVDPDAGNISLMLTAPDRAAGDRIFKALSEGGTVKMPMDEVFWGGRFGMIHDRFGLEWMISTP